MLRVWNYFTREERILWAASMAAIWGAFLAFDRENYGTLAASVLGVTSLIFAAKGNPISQILMILFSLIYGWISYACAYYGEMITYVGMSGPMAVVGLISWLRHPFQGNRAQVQVNRVAGQEFVWLGLLTAVVTGIFYFILRYFHTANLLPSTLSVATTFFAVYLTFRRSPFYALGYAANDVVLILLWILAAREDRSYLSMAVCFLAFLVNDLYGFFSWRRMEKLQKPEFSTDIPQNV